MEIARPVRSLATIDEWTADGSRHETEIEADTPYVLKSNNEQIATFSVDSNGSVSILDASGSTEQTLGIVPLTRGNLEAQHGSIPLSKDLHAPESVDTAGLVYTFTFSTPTAAQIEAAAVDGLEYAGSVTLPTTTLTASAMTAAMDGTQSLSDIVPLPDPNTFPHAGMYWFTVTEAVPNAVNNASWVNDRSEYRVRVFVSNEIVNGAYTGNLVYGNSAANDGSTAAHASYVIERIKNADGTAATLDENGIGLKVQSLAFTNTYDGKQDLRVEKRVAGAYADRTFEFPFEVELTLPSYSANSDYSYTLTGELNYGQGETNPNTAGKVTVANHEGSIKVRLSDGESIVFSQLPVGTKFSVNESQTYDGVNRYVPSAVHTYKGTGAANSGYEDSVNPTSGLATDDSFEVDATTASPNTSTILGDASGNQVVFTNTLSNPPSPTGIIMYAAPAVLPLAILSIFAALGVWQLSRRKVRKNDMSL